MLKVLKYSLGYTFRKKSTPILLALLFILAFGIPLVAYIGGILKETTYNFVKTEVFFNGMFSIVLIPIFLMFVSYIAVVTGQIFKRGEEDGTTLMLVSSRYTRSQVILGRFGAVAIHLAIIAVIVAFGMSLASWFYQPSEAKYEIVSLISVIFGAFFIGLLFASLSLIFSILMGRIGAIVIVVFTFVLFSILSPILLMLSANSQYDLTKLNRFSTYSHEAQHDTYVFEDSNNNIQTQEALYQTVPNSNEKLLLDKLSSPSYSTVGWFDIWTQISQMMGAFDSKSSHPTSLDRISPISIKDTEFFKNLKKLDTGANTIDNPDKKMLFGLADIFKKALSEAENYDADVLSQAQIQKLDNTYEEIVGKIKTNEFKALVSKYETAFNQVKDFEVTYTSSGYTSFPLSAMAAIINEMVENNLTINASSKMELTGSHFPVLTEFKINGQSNSSIVDFTKHGQDVFLGDDREQILKRVAIYYAIFDANKLYATSNQPSGSQPAKLKDEIQDSFKAYFGNRFYSSSKMAADSLEQQLGYTYSHDPIVPGPFIYVFWPAVALGLFGLAFVLHRRADFK